MRGGVVGTRQRRLEGRAKVTGAARFAADLRLDGLAHARLVLSPHASAVVEDVAGLAASRVPGVLAVLTSRDLPCPPSEGPGWLLAADRVSYCGQPVAVVVATTEAGAADASDLVEVAYRPLPAVVDAEAALRPNAPRVLPADRQGGDEPDVHGTGGGDAATYGGGAPNLTARISRMRGRGREALEACAAAVAGRYSLPAVHHASLEPHVAIAAWEPDGDLTVWTPTQGQYLTRQGVAAALGLELARVRVRATPAGGAFGGKLLLLEPLVALLARVTGRAVRLELTRTEEFLMGRGGPACTIELALGSDIDGHLEALVADAVFDNGAGPGGLCPLMVTLLGGTYRVPNYEVTASDVMTNTTPATSYRAPGAPQAYFALESAMDELALRLGMDPIEFRLRNASREGDDRPGLGHWPRIGLVECLEAARVHPLAAAGRWRDKGAAPGVGVGVAVGSWAGAVEPAAAGCRVDPDGGVTVIVGCQDITGTDTGLAMLAAEALGVPMGAVRVEKGDTSLSPYGGVAGGSKTIYTVGPAVLAAAADARRQLLEIAAEELEADPADLETADGQVRVAGVPAKALRIGELAALGLRAGSGQMPVHGHGRAAVSQRAPMFTVHLARAEVDLETGGQRLLGYAAIQDVGRAVNPAEIEGQVHGGALQGIGRALGEELAHGADGSLRTANLGDYGLPTIDQAPPTEVVLVEVPSPAGPLGSRGVGEPPAVPGAAAVANAVAAACRRRARRLPLVPEELAAPSGEQRALAADEGTPAAELARPIGGNGGGA